MAVIPARGGSKRIPHKNVRLFRGRPMIAWAIEAARNCGVFDKIVVSTDHEEIASVARQCGAETPFTRPQELSDDFAGVMPVVAHAINWCAERGLAADPVCLIYATAPLLEASDIVRGLEALETSNAQFALSVASFASPIQRALWKDERGRVQMFQPEHYTKRSQDLVESFHDAAQFCWGRTAAWRGTTPIFLSDCAAVLIPRFRVQDIDTLEDWERAEMLFAVSRMSEGGD